MPSPGQVFTIATSWVCLLGGNRGPEKSCSASFSCCLLLKYILCRRFMYQWAFPPNLGPGHSGINLLSSGRCFLECEIQARHHSWRWRWRSLQIAHGASYMWMPHFVEKLRLETALCTTSKVLFLVWPYLCLAPAFALIQAFVSRFLTAQDCALLISLRSCACALPLSPAPLLYPQNPPKAPPWSPGQRLQSYWTNLFLGFYYRFFRAETILETPGLVLCLVKNNGVGKRLEEQPNPGRKPSMPAHPLPHCPSWCWAVCAVGLDGVCWPFRQVHCEGCYRLASAGGGRTEREGGRWKVHIYHIWDFAWFVLNQSTANYLPSPS